MNVQVAKRRETRFMIIWSVAIISVFALLVGAMLMFTGQKSPVLTGLVGGSTSSGFISPISNTNSNGAETIAEYNAATTENNDSATSKLAKSAGLTAESPTLSGLTLDLKNADSRVTEEGATILHVPFIVDGAVLSISGATVIFDEQNNIVSTGEVVYTEHSDLAGKVEIWQDGNKVLDREIVVPPSEAGDGSGVSPAFNWDKLNKCLGDANISSWVIAAIGVSCGIVCGATLGVGCLACVVAVSGVTGGTIGHCVAIAM